MVVLAVGIARADNIGIPACDDYVTKYQACIAKAPANTHDTYQKNLDSMTASWTKMAADPKNKDGVEKSCISATESAKKSMKMWGCEF